ncbi:MAG: SpoVR family protein [Gammaproteobacteria bacterium]
MKKKHPLPTGSEWSFETLKRYEHEIARVAADFGLDTYPNQVEVINAEQMIDNYATIGMPLGYFHWSFGKQYINVEKSYKRGLMGLAYEMVINSNPCIAYLLEENTLVMQATVIAHACYGHNSFFKGNYLFKTWTSPESIIDYLVFSRNFIAECEQQHGIDEVELLLDACHALMNYGIDRYKRPQALSLQEEKARQKMRETYLQAQVNELWRTIPNKRKTSKESQLDQQHFPKEPEENILYFLEKNAPLLEPWQREVIRIVRKIARYFYPQRLTKLMNEGWATFWHYTIINAIYDEGLLTDEFMLEFIENHTGVIQQLDYSDRRYNGLNPYALGYHIFSDIKRICESPTDEDKIWFPDIVNKPWQGILDFAMRNFKDDSFIAQYLSPHVIREMKLFAILDEPDNTELVVSAIHDESGYRRIRDLLSSQYNLSLVEPNIQVYDVDIRGDRSLTLRHVQQDSKPLSDTTPEVLKYLHYLWGFDVTLESVTPSGTFVCAYHCPEKAEPEST